VADDGIPPLLLYLLLHCVFLRPTAGAPGLRSLFIYKNKGLTSIGKPSSLRNVKYL
jgi:hypothetical protein